MNKDQRGNSRGSINQPRTPQVKTVQRRPLQPVPHINQHSVHMQRVAQAKMAQTRTAPQRTAPVRNATQLKRPNAATRSGVVQRAECWSGVVDSVKSCWNSCFGTPRREQYQELSSSESASSDSFGSGSTVSTTLLRPQQVPEKGTVRKIPYPGAVDGGYISSCALVIFCFDDYFDCYHAKGGTHELNHGMGQNPKHIFYVYKVDSSDTAETIKNYERNAWLFQYHAGNKPKMDVFGQDLKGNVWVNVHSPEKITPGFGTFK